MNSRIYFYSYLRKKQTHTHLFSAIIPFGVICLYKEKQRSTHSSGPKTKMIEKKRNEKKKSKIKQKKRGRKTAISHSIEIRISAFRLDMKIDKLNQRLIKKGVCGTLPRTKKRMIKIT